jgi:hypothetical protein
MATNKLTKPLHLFSQELPNWCWAAAAEMVLRFYDYYDSTCIKQCNLANEQFGQSNCCSQTQNGDDPIQLDDIPVIYSNHGLQSDVIDSSISMNSLDAEITAGHPVEVVFEWTGGGGHVAIVYGIDINLGWIFVHDPLPSRNFGVVTYDDLASAYGHGKWVATVVNIHYRPANGE